MKTDTPSSVHKTLSTLTGNPLKAESDKTEKSDTWQSYTAFKINVSAEGYYPNVIMHVSQSSTIG